MGNLIKFGCKNCCSPHLRERNDGRIHCISCGEVFERDIETKEERDARILYLARLDNAEKLLRLSPPRFDDAEDEFCDFIKHYPRNSDGYWGLVRARYGIKYEIDINGKNIPSCYKSSYKDFRRDSDFMKALEFAENDKIYDNLQNRAKLIADVCKEWHEETKKYSYDIFISFNTPKEDLGISDADQKEMSELYTHLLEAGYKVFFSPRSMRQYNGKHYDAYIFNALQSSKILIVYGSKPECFTTTWVQNEWTRFLKMVANGEKKKDSCIVAYNGFNPYMLPHGLRETQAMDASKNNRLFYSNLLSTIKSVLADEKKVDTNEELMKQIQDLRHQFENKQNGDKTKDIDPDFEIVDGCLKSYKGNQKNVIIPNSVTSIDDGAFSECDSVNSVVVPNSVTSIGEEVFSSCQNLSVVIIPDSVKYVGDDAFSDCEDITIWVDSLEQAEKWDTDWNPDEFPVCVLKKAELEREALIKSLTNESLTNIEIDPDFEIVNGCLVKYNGNASDVVIPDSVTSIGNSAFNSNKKLTSVKIPNSITSIGGYAFHGCNKLKKVNIPNSVNLIRENTFSSCTSLISVVIPDGLISIGDCAFEDCSNLASIGIPNSVTTIGDLAFHNCNSLTRVVIPDGVTRICRYTFCSCKNLASVRIPNSIISIGAYAFSGCESLSDVEIPDSVDSIDDHAFQYCKTLSYVKLANGVVSIGKSAFSNCENLSHIDIPDSVASIGDFAFGCCFGLASMVIGDGIASIGNDALYGCKNLTVWVNDISKFKNSIYLNRNDWNPDGRPICTIEKTTKSEIAMDFEIVDGCLKKYKGQKTHVVIPEGVTSIDDKAFYNKKKLISVIIPNNVTHIGNEVFHGCRNLVAVSIPNSVTSIGDRAFKHCSSIASVVIPNSVTNIGKYVFCECSNLKKVLISNCITSINTGMFFKCSKLDNVILPKSITSIGKFAFCDCHGFTSIALPESVTSIGPYAFEGCKNVIDVTIPDKVTSIGSCAFSGCKQLREVVIPKNVDFIGEYAFSECRNLISVDFKDVCGWRTMKFLKLPAFFFKNRKRVAKSLRAKFFSFDFCKNK